MLTRNELRAIAKDLGPGWRVASNGRHITHKDASLTPPDGEKYRTWRCYAGYFGRFEGRGRTPREALKKAAGIAARQAAQCSEFERRLLLLAEVPGQVLRVRRDGTIQLDGENQ